MRVLVAYGEDYRAYREMIAAGVRLLRPGPRSSCGWPGPVDLQTQLIFYGPRAV